MQTELALLKIEGLLLAIVHSLGEIWLLGVVRNRPLWLDQVQKLHTELWLLGLVNFCGCNHFWEIWEFMLALL